MSAHFKVRKIRQTPRGNRGKIAAGMQRLARKKKMLATALVGLGLLFIVGTFVLDAGFFRTVVRPIFSFSELRQDKYGHTNILLLGVGGVKAEGGNLSDSIMIVSIDPQGPSVSMMSLPRDLFVHSDIGDRKVNEVYAAARFEHGDEKGLRIAKDAVEEFAQVDIHYGAVIDFQVFEDVIDALGGIEIFVPEDITDPFYPDDNYGYQTFVVRKGLQHFDGETALKYARSRKTTSDYDRARRQQDLLLALRKRAENLNLLGDLGKLRDFYELYKKNVNTDLGLAQMLALAKIGVGLDFNNALSAVLHDDPTKKGGFLYPPAREFYGGQFVLLPKDFYDTQQFIHLVLRKPHILLEKKQISVLNGSKIDGKAGQLTSRLRRLGFHVIDVGNFETDRPLVQTTIHSYAGENETAKYLKTFLSAKRADEQMVQRMPTDELIDIRVVIGTN